MEEKDIWEKKKKNKKPRRVQESPLESKTMTTEMQHQAQGSRRQRNL